MSNDAAVVCQASVITLHILRWAQAVQSIWTKDSSYGTCGAHTRYVIWQAVSPPNPQKNDRKCQLPWHCQEQRWRRWGKRPKSRPRPSCSICWKRSNQLYSSNNLLINYIKRNAFLHTWNRNGNHSMVIDSIVWAKFCRTAVFLVKIHIPPKHLMRGSFQI